MANKMKPQDSLTIKTRVAHATSRLTEREVGYIYRIRAVYLDVEEDTHLPLALRDELTGYLFLVIDALLAHVSERP